MDNLFLTKIPQQNKKPMRESGIELLRCLSIFFVVIIHQINVYFLDENGTVLFVSIFRMLTWPAIFSFSFITGYFLINKKDGENKIKSFLWLTIELVIWRILLSIINLIILSFVYYRSFEDFGYNITEIFIDLVSIRFWYFWAIIFVYLIFPFLNSYLEHHYQAGKKLLKWLVVLLLIISLLATTAILLEPVLNYNFSLYTDEYTLIIVLTTALMGGYWHLIEQDRKINVDWKWQLIGLTGLISVYLINFSTYWWGRVTGILSYTNILWYFSGFFYFLIFKGFHFKNKFVNWWASLSWGIYVLHNGSFLPRGLAPKIGTTIPLDYYSLTIVTILICYLLSIFLVITVQSLDNFVIKPVIINPIKKLWKEKWKQTLVLNKK